MGGLFQKNVNLTIANKLLSASGNTLMVMRLIVDHKQVVKLIMCKFDNRFFKDVSIFPNKNVF